MSLDTLRGILEALELDLILSMRRNLERHMDEEKKQGFKFEQWQRAKLRDIKRYQLKNAAIIQAYDEALKKQSRAFITEGINRGFEQEQKAFEAIKNAQDMKVSLPVPAEEVIEGLSGDDLKAKLLTDKATREAWDAAQRPQETQFFRMDDRRLNQLIRESTGDIRKVEAAILRTSPDIYREIIFKAQVHYNSGGKTLRQAVDLAAKEFLEQGITAISYKDGKRVNIKSYIEMALRTGRHRAYLHAGGETRNKLGVYTVLISAHATSCNLCLPWQGQVLIDDVFANGTPTGAYPLLSLAIDKGLLHPNCEHNIVTFYPGINTPPVIPEEETVKRNYAAAQKQRALERMIHRQKRIVTGTLDPDTRKKEKEILAQYQQQMKEHLKANPQLRRKPEREAA